MGNGSNWLQESCWAVHPPKEPFFPVHTLNYKGTQQYDPITEPPLTAHLTTVEINALKNIPLKSKFECHTQSVERGVALTADSVKRRRTADTYTADVCTIYSCCPRSMHWENNPQTL